MNFTEYLPIVWVAVGVALLLVLNMKSKLNSVIALLISAIVVGVLNNMKLLDAISSIKSGFGGTLGSLAM